MNKRIASALTKKKSAGFFKEEAIDEDIPLDLIVIFFFKEKYL